MTGWIIVVLFFLYLIIGIPGNRWVLNHEVWAESPSDYGPFMLFWSWLLWGPMALIALALVYVQYRQDHPWDGKVTRLFRKLFVK